MSSATLLSNALAIVRRKLWFVALASVALLFGLPIRLALQLQNYAGYAVDPGNDWRIERLQTILDSFFSYHDPTTAILLGLLALAAGLVFCKYMHDKSQVDFFHSLPRTRSRLLIENVLAAALSVLLPFLACQLLSVAAALAMGFGMSVNWGSMLIGWAVSLLLFCSVLFTVVAAATLAGHGLVSAIIAGVFLGFVPAALGVYRWVRAMWQPAWYDALTDWDALLAHSSPVFRWGCLCIDYNNYYLLSVGDIVALLVYTAAALVLALLFYSRRPSETAGRALAFPLSRIVFKYPLTLLFSAVLAMTMYEIGGFNGHLWYYVGLILGVFLTAQACEIIYAFDFHRLFRRWVAMLVTVFCVVGVSAFFILDVPGYNRYVPEAEVVRGADLVLRGVDFSFDNSVAGVLSDDGNTYANAEELLAQTHTADAAALTALTEMANIATSGASQVENGHTSVRLIVRWQLADGSEKVRAYQQRVDICDVSEQLTALYADDAFRASRLSLFDLPAGCVRLNNISSYYELNDSYKSYGYDAAQSDSLINADISDFLEVYEQELAAFDATDMRRELPVGQLNFYAFATDPGQAEQDKYSGVYVLPREYLTLSYPMYASFTQSIAALEKLGVEARRWQEDWSNVQAVEVYSYDYAGLLAADAITYDVPTALAAKEGYAERLDAVELFMPVLADALPSEARRMNGFVELNEQIELSVEYLGPDGELYSTWFYPLLNAGK